MSRYPAVALRKNVSESSGSDCMLTPGAAFSRRRIAARARPSRAMPCVASAPEPDEVLRLDDAERPQRHLVRRCETRTAVRSPLPSGVRRPRPARDAWWPAELRALLQIR